MPRPPRTLQPRGVWRHEPGPSGGVFVIPKKPLWGASVFGFAGVVLVAVAELYNASILFDAPSIPGMAFFCAATLVLGIAGWVVGFATLDMLGVFGESLWLSAGDLCVGSRFLGGNFFSKRLRLEETTVLEVPDRAPDPPEPPASRPGGTLTVEGAESMRGTGAPPSPGAAREGAPTTGLVLRTGRRRVRFAEGVSAEQAAALADQLAVHFGLKKAGHGG